MTINTNEVFNVFINDEVKQSYQFGSKLLSTVKVKNNIKGITARFQKIGKGIATPRIPQSDVIPMNIDYTPTTVTLENWNAPEYTAYEDLAKLNFDEKREVAEVISKAIGRRIDEVILQRLDTDANPTTVALNSSGLTLDKLRTTKKMMDKKGVPSMDRYFLHSAEGLEDLLKDPEVTSADYNTVKSLVNGELNTYLGFKFIMIEDRVEGGLPLDGSNVRTNFAYHKDSIGMAIGYDVKTKTDWIPEKTSWLINGMFSGAAAVVDNEGVYKVFSQEQ